MDPQLAAATQGFVIGTAISMHEVTACPSGCLYCAAGVGHITMRCVGGEELTTGLNLGGPCNDAKDCGFGTHLKEALDIVRDWWQG